jgi:hypothetical protein
VLHAILHAGGWQDPFGYHYWSENGGSEWFGNTDVLVYEGVAKHADGTLSNFSRRERPHVMLGEY